MKQVQSFVFKGHNYCLFLISVLFIITGFMLMSGNANHGAGFFNEDIYSFRRITLAPLFLIAGYGLVIFAVMIEKPKRSDHAKTR